jgi:RNA polymerase sigma-70 factor (ECF subfamily)
MAHAGTVDRMDAEPQEAQRLATEARGRGRVAGGAPARTDQVYRVARHLANSREDADELMQETYARAFRSWRSFTPGTNMRAWLLRILTNLNIDRGRRQQRAPQMQPLEANDYFLYDKLAENGDGVTDEDQVVERLSQDDIVTALSEVPHDFRDVLVLVDLGDFSYADAAQIHDIPVGTVMSRLHRGRRILKRELAESALEEAT